MRRKKADEIQPSLLSKTQTDKRGQYDDIDKVDKLLIFDSLPVAVVALSVCVCECVCMCVCVYKQGVLFKHRMSMKRTEMKSGHFKRWEAKSRTYFMSLFIEYSQDQMFIEHGDNSTPSKFSRCQHHLFCTQMRNLRIKIYRTVVKQKGFTGLKNNCSFKWIFILVRYEHLSI